jgi:hypothetical protein
MNTISHVSINVSNNVKYDLDTNRSLNLLGMTKSVQGVAEPSYITEGCRNTTPKAL